MAYGFVNDITASSGGSFSEVEANITDTTAQSTRTFEIIECNTSWLIILLLASISLVGASVASGGILRVGRVTPELLLNWTTTLRNCPNLESGGSGSFLDDVDRMRQLKGTRIMFGDVTPDREVGRLGVTVQSDTSTVVRANRTRLYE